METSEQINEIATALAKAQGEIKGAVKDATNPHFKSQYATLSAVWDACRVPLSKNGLSAIQTVSTDENAATVVTTMLMHSSGQWIKDSISCRPEKATAQGIGSAITYMRRYALSAIAGVAPDDDDGEAAVGRMEPAKKTATVPIMGRRKKGELQTAVKALRAEIEGATDDSELSGILNDPKHIEIMEQCRKDMPNWWFGDDRNPDYVPMDKLIQDRQQSFEGDSHGIS